MSSSAINSQIWNAKAANVQNADGSPFYVTGTWAPTVTCAGGSPGTYSVTKAMYTKIGRQVTASCLVTLGTVSGSPTSISVTLPVAADANYTGSGSGMVADTGTSLSCVVSSDATFRKYDATNPAVTGYVYRITVTYFTA